MSKNVLIVNFGGFGDILNTTCIAKHFKETQPDRKTVWLTRKKYSKCIENNQYIDKIIYNDESLEHMNNVVLTKHYQKLFKEKNVEAYFTAPYSSVEKNTILARSSLLDIIKYEFMDKLLDFNQEIIPIINITTQEEQEAKDFFNNLDKKNKNILLEYETFSGQSPFDENYFEILSKHIHEKGYNLIFTGLKSPKYMENNPYDIKFYHYSGSFMSNAALYNLCDGFIGTSSGVTCLTSAKYCNIATPRIEVSHGYHWSTIGWGHNLNKRLVFYKKQFKEALEEYF
jgi:ADP-heptose:LPS heptosyltransferase